MAGWRVKAYTPRFDDETLRYMLVKETAAQMVGPFTRRYEVLCGGDGVPIIFKDEYSAIVEARMLNNPELRNAARV